MLFNSTAQDVPNEGGQDERQRSSSAPANGTPSYLRHTFSSKSSGSSQHAEVERVVNSFRSSNFLSLHALPSDIKPGGIEESKRKRISSGRSSKPEHIHRQERSNKAYFTPVTYSRDEYMKVAADDKRERQYKQLTTLSFSRKPFTYATSRIRLKNEDIFGDEKYKFPVLGPGSGVAELETVVRTDFTDASKMLHGPFFVPARVQQEFPRDELALWGREVFTCLERDWSHLRFSLRCTGDEELVVTFDMGKEPSYSDSTASSEHMELAQNSSSPLVTALGRYMNTMALHGVANHRRLRKRGDRWKVFEYEGEKNNENDGKENEPARKRVLVFSFYTPWFTSATRNIQKKESVQERVAARNVELQARTASANERKSTRQRRETQIHAGGGEGKSGLLGSNHPPTIASASTTSPRSE